MKDDSSEKVTPSRKKESISELFKAKDTLDQPCDVVLMVKDGREFRAHRRVLSEASPFFEKMLNSDMKETQEGVVRLEMFTESIMAATLQFMYTGDVEILAEDTARELIVVADYLFLEKVKLLAGGVLVQALDTSNCISTYYFAAKYQCQDLLSNTSKFISANFTSIYAADHENVLNMSSREVEMWISSDEIDVSAEEDVFKFILAWIDYDRSERKIFFAELFRHVRLVYVSRDFLRHDIAKNKLVKGNNSCLTLVKDAINLLDTKNFESLSVPPRKSLETPVVVVNVGKNILCYNLRENSWCKLGEIPPAYTTITRSGNFVPCDGQLYRTVQSVQELLPLSLRQVTYNPYSNSWTELPAWEEGRYLRKTFVSNGDEIYALLSEPCVENHLRIWHLRCSSDQTCRSRKHTSFLTKYKPETNSWEDVTSFDHLNLRDDFCIVANENFIYFIGGRECGKCAILTDVDRFELSRKQWVKAADTQMATCRARGAAVTERIYITGPSGPPRGCPFSYDFEVYDETTNEWQIITGVRDGLGYSYVDFLAVDAELYLVEMRPCVPGIATDTPKQIRMERYYPEENKWQTKTDVKARRASFCGFQPDIVCSMRIFKGLFNMREVEAFPFHDSLPGAGTTQPSLPSRKREQKCLIM